MQFRNSSIHISEGRLCSAPIHINPHITNANDRFYLFFFCPSITLSVFNLLRHKHHRYISAIKLYFMCTVSISIDSPGMF
jgi:hypothetical protein